MKNPELNWQFVFSNLKPFKRLLGIQFFVSTIWAIDLSLRPYLLKVLIDIIQTTSKNKVLETLFWPTLFFIATMSSVVIFYRIYDYTWIYLNSPLKRQLGNALMSRMMQHSHTQFSDHFSGTLANQVKDVMSYIPDLCKLVIHNFYGHFLALFIAIWALSRVHLRFGLMLSLWVTVFLVGSTLLSRRAQRLSHLAAAVRSGVVGRMVDIFGNMMSVRLFAGSYFESKNLNQTLDQYVKADQARDWYFLYLFGFQGFSFLIYQVSCVLVLINGFQLGDMTAGDFFMVLTINISLVDSLWKISEDISKFVDYTGSIAQGLRIVLKPFDIQDKPNAEMLSITEGKIIFDKVKFHYGTTEPLFHNKSIGIEPGQKVGLVGYSGSGKSTFVNLILRLFDVVEGRILIDGQDIRHVTQDSLRNHIGMIPQDPSLFHRSLFENIQYGCLEATKEEVIEAAKRAYAHEFIVKLPQGYESFVGERGVKLSGGQRQRIAIARAILKNAPILILDEATSQLDSVTESHIQESLWKLMQGKTTLVIAHRLSTLLHMDRILVFDKGKIMEDGSHQALIAQNGLYKTLWSTQVGGFLPDMENNSLFHQRITKDIAI